MRTEAGSGRGIVVALVLAVALGFVGWLCFRAAAVRALPAGSPLLLRIAPHDPDATLGTATVLLVQRRGILAPATLDAVREAALADPLDARPFLILGHQSLLDGQPGRAVKTLEAGQRLDPRQRVIHLLLLDRYLRDGRYRDAAAQFSALARLVGSTQAPIAAAMAQMSVAPETRDAVRATLRSDPALERAVLTALAKTDTDPALIFGLAGPAALADAGAPDGWGRALVTRLVERGRFAAARSVWARFYGVGSARLAAPIYDAELRGLPGSPPFNWSMTAGTAGAADLRGGRLTIDYYGRDTSELASQLLLLRPGAYRFDFVLDTGQAATGPHLSWTLICQSGSKAVLMTIDLPTKATSGRRMAATFTVPAGCPAQRLALSGIAGEFPAPINATLRSLALRPAGSSAR